MSQQFNPGDLVFDRLGRVFQYVAEHPSDRGHVCLQWFGGQDEDGCPSEYAGDPVTLTEVFKDADEVVQKTEARLADLQAKCDVVRLELAGLMKDRGAFDAEIKARAERIKRHAQLERIDDFLAGKITHLVVVPEYYQKIEVLPLDVALKSIDQYDKGLKLLTLYGTTKGDLQFRINRYSDGSGNSQGDAYPFCSEEDAQAFAKKLAAEKLANSIAGKLGGFRGDGIPAGLEGWITTADAYGVPVPQEWRDKVKAQQLANAMAHAEDLQKKADEARARVLSLKAAP